MEALLLLHKFRTLKMVPAVPAVVGLPDARTPSVPIGYEPCSLHEGYAAGRYGGMRTDVVEKW